MSKSVKRVVKNSFFQSIGALILTALNLVLMLGYARIYGPESFGSLMTAQAQVLVWGWLVDLGLSQSLISALTRAEGTKSDQVRQRFRARDLLFRVLLIRMAGACIGCIVILSIGRLNNHWTEADLWQRAAFCPFLFAAAFLQTGIAYSSFLHRQAMAVLAQISGVVITVAVPLYLAAHGVALPWVLLSQSVGGFFSGSVIYGIYFFESAKRRQLGTTRRLDRTLRPDRFRDLGV
ncbi:MAG: lipopolysaccharide biosynthesis protein [Bdellovibrionota bacterium]